MKRLVTTSAENIPMILSRRSTCRGCFGKDLVEFANLGQLPLAGAFLLDDQVPFESRFPLSVHFCRQCSLVQILDVVPPDELFQGYQYISSVIRGLSDHFAEYATYLFEQNFLAPGSFLVEFGCNDGVLLEHLRHRDITILGIDASENISDRARNKGLPVLTGYFKEDLARRVRQSYGAADVVTGSNVFAHVDDVHAIVEGANVLLKPDGVFIVEVHCLVDLLRDGQYDTIYHEHLNYYSVHSLQQIMTRHEMKILDVVHLPMHGGTIRVIAAPNSSRRQVNPSVAEVLEKERQLGLTTDAIYFRFGENARRHALHLHDFLVGLRREGSTISAYGASGRGTILLNYAKIGKDLLDYVVDVSPLRCNKLMPGVHIPIFPPSHLSLKPTDFSLMLAWNYRDHIVAQEQAYLSGGGRFIIPFPDIRQFP